jgi:hypothetical protein
MGNEASRTKVLQDVRHPALVHSPIESGLLRRYDPLRRLDARWTAAYAGARHRNSEVRRSPLGGDNVATFEMKSSVGRVLGSSTNYWLRYDYTLFSRNGKRGEILAQIACGAWEYRTTRGIANTRSSSTFTFDFDAGTRASPETKCQIRCRPVLVDDASAPGHGERVRPSPILRSIFDLRVIELDWLHCRA